MSHICFIVGENKSGKSYLQENLLAHSKKFMRLISTTSREKRPGEEEGVHYYFKSKETISNLIKNNKTLQHVEFAGNYYCTTLKQYKTKKTLIFVCTPDGITDTIKQLKSCGDEQLKDTRYSIIYCKASRHLLNSRGFDDRSARGTITEDFEKAYNAGLYAEIPLLILSDSELNRGRDGTVLKRILDFLK